MDLTATDDPVTRAAAPTITTTLAQLAAAEPALARLAAVPAPAKVAYHVAKLVRLVGVEVKFFHERRNALISDLGEERPATEAERAQGHQGTVMQVKADQVAAFTSRLTELGDVGVTITWGALDLAAIPDLTITPADLLALGPLVTDAA